MRLSAGACVVSGASSGAGSAGAADVLGARSSAAGGGLGAASLSSVDADEHADNAMSIPAETVATTPVRVFAERLSRIVRPYRREISRD